MRAVILSLISLLLSIGVFAQTVSIIPKPVSLKVSPGTFTIDKSTAIVVKKDSERKVADYLNLYLQEIYGFKLPVNKSAGKIRIHISSEETGNAKESYTLTVNNNGIDIAGSSDAGTFYGIQTLIQLLPLNKTAILNVPFVTVKDQPRFSYRGLHLDVGRHLFPLPFIKKYIDYIALHKMNYFHWHLTEDQGWRIEIKKYPELTRTGAYRNGTIIGPFPGTGNDSIRYGGFYTQDQVREIVKYAADRHVTVIPEIEMPGHASAALASYPFLGCPGTGPYKVEETWGIFDDIYCGGKDSTFLFLQDVLDEVMPLFPSKYVHIGGDEAPKTNWKVCPLCQKRIKDENLKDEHGLQSYFIQRMEKYLNSKGKTTIGWDEILEGGLAPNAIVMSWRGEEGGIEAAKQKHQVIMTPGTHVYMDHSQSQHEDSVTIGGYISVEKTYSYEPIPAALTADQAKYIMGAQGNVWTEYMRYPSKVEYQIFPRLSALSEVLWSPKESRSWEDFEPRLLKQFERYKLWGNNYSKAYYDIRIGIEPAPKDKGIILNLSTKDKTGKISYALNGRSATNFNAPLAIKENAKITALYTDREGKIADSVSLNFYINKATGKTITLKEGPSPYFPGNGNITLVDGILNESGARTGESMGFQKDVEATIDLNTVQEINNVTVHSLNSGGTYVYPPQSVTVSASADGKAFTELSSSGELEVIGTKAIVSVPAKANARYVKVFVKRLPVVPAGKRGAGESTWLYLDEIQVN